MYNCDDVIRKIIDDEHSLNRDDVERNIITFSLHSSISYVFRSLTAINHDISDVVLVRGAISYKGCR